MPPPFIGESPSVLTAYAAALRAGQLVMPLTKMGLARVARGSETLEAELLRLSLEGMSAAHIALVLDVAAAAAQTQADGSISADLVWTGPESVVAHSRDTSVVISELFAQARRQVLVSTFVVQHGDVVFEALANRMEQIPDLSVRLFLHIARDWKDTRDNSELLREFAAALARQWPWPQRPEAYYDPRGLSKDPAERVAWHAKCVVVDDDLALVTSANFTEWAQKRNVEAGVLLRNRHFAGQLRQQFEGLIQSKQVRRLPGF